MHPAIIIGIVRLLIVDVAMGQIPRFTERISSYVLLLHSTAVLNEALSAQRYSCLL